MPKAAIIPALKQTDIERFWSKVQIPENKEECWLWIGYKRKGYGSMSIAPTRAEEKSIPAHRISYYLAHNNEIDRYKVVMHDCDNPSCVNPSHLILGTDKQNSQDRGIKGRGSMTFQPGENHPNSKLTYNDIEEIRNLISQGKSQGFIAKQFNVDQSLISRIHSNVYWRKEMIQPITNCGLRALRSINELKNISIRTLLNLAEDNGVELYPYRLPVEELANVELPAIFHADNHFEYITEKKQLYSYNLTGVILTTKPNVDYTQLPESEFKTVQGASWIAAGITAGTAAIQLGTAAIQNKKAKEIAKNNIRPEYVPSKEILENANLAASRAGQGLGDASKALFTQENERNLSQSLDAILRGGGGVNQISDLYANNQDAMLKLASLDNNLKTANINQFYTNNSAKAQELQSAWQINEFDPYLNRAQLSAQLKGNAVSNFNNGLNTAAGGVSNYLTSTLYKPQSQKVGNLDASVDSAGREIIIDEEIPDYSQLTPPQRLIEEMINPDSQSLYDYQLGWKY